MNRSPVLYPHFIDKGIIFHVIQVLGICRLMMNNTFVCFRVKAVLTESNRARLFQTTFIKATLFSIRLKLKKLTIFEFGKT